MMQFGTHLIVDIYHCDEKALSDRATLQQFLETLPGEMGMHPITEPVIKEVGPNNKKDPGGISGFVMIAESHIAFHTFPKRGFFTADVYTCQNDLAAEKFVEKFKALVGSDDIDMQVIKRGVRYPEEDIY